MVKLNHSIFYLLLAALLFPLRLFAEPSLRTEVHPNYGTIDDAFIFSAVVDNADASAGPPLLTGGNDFTLSFIGPESTVQITNGSVKRQVIYNYQLVPKHEGALSTPSAELSVEGQKLTAPPVAVTVSGARAVAPDEQNKDYFMRQSIETHPHIYVGEQLALTFEISMRVTLINAQFDDFTFPGFQNEQLGEQETTQRLIAGEPYTVSYLRRALYPLKAGTLELPVRELRAKVRVSSRNNLFPFGSIDPFDPNFVDDFFSAGKLKDVTVRSNPLEIQVEAPPPLPADLPLLGLNVAPVGETALELNYDPSAIKFGETKTVTLTVGSVGSIQSLKSSGLKSTPELRVYEDAPEAKTGLRGNKLVMRKTFKLSLVPTVGGSVKLPPFAIGYLDPQTGNYAVARTKPIEFSVTGAPAPAPTSAPQPSSAASNSEQQTSAAPLRYEEPTLLEKLSQQISPALALLLGVAAIGLGAAIWAGLRIRKHFAAKRRQISSIEKAETIDAIAQALRMLVTRSYPVLSPHFSREELRRAVTNADLLYRIEAVLDRCDAALFGGKNVTLEALRPDALAVARALQ